MADVLQTKATVFGRTLDGRIDSLDNGVGFMGADTRDPGLKGVSIPIDAFKSLYGGVSRGKQAISQFGSPMIEVTNPATGLSGVYPLVDLGPGLGPQSRGVGLDLTYGAAQELGSTGLDPVQFRIASAPGATGQWLPGTYGTQGGLPLPPIDALTDVVLNPTSDLPQIRATGRRGAEEPSGGGSFPIGFGEGGQQMFSNNPGQAIGQALGEINRGVMGGDIRNPNLFSGLGGSLRNLVEGDLGTDNLNPRIRGLSGGGGFSRIFGDLVGGARGGDEVTNEGNPFERIGGSLRNLLEGDLGTGNPNPAVDRIQVGSQMGVGGSGSVDSSGGSSSVASDMFQTPVLDTSVSSSLVPTAPVDGTVAVAPANTNSSLGNVTTANATPTDTSANSNMGTLTPFFAGESADGGSGDGSGFSQLAAAISSLI